MSPRAAMEEVFPRGGGWRSYHRVTRTARYGFLMALPLFALYEGLILFANAGQAVQVRVGAEVWIKGLLALVGVTGFAALGAVLLVVGAAVVYRERNRRVPIRPRYFAWMIAESALYAVVLAALVSSAVGLIFAAVPPPPWEGFWTRVALSIGAGLYEELLFRVVLVGGLYWVLRRVLSTREKAYAAAAVVGALLFSTVHYIGALGDVFTLPSFTFRFLFGLALNLVFLLRGFGVAAWTHALYDLMLVIGGAA